MQPCHDMELYISSYSVAELLLTDLFVVLISWFIMYYLVLHSLHVYTMYAALFSQARTALTLASETTCSMSHSDHTTISQLPPLPPPPLPPYNLAQPSAMHTTQKITHTETDIDVLHYKDFKLNLDELEKFQTDITHSMILLV